jgi:hypothetical protein
VRRWLHTGLTWNLGPLADHLDNREDDLRKAIAMSEEEEAKRRRQLEESNATALFDDGLQMCVVFSLVSEKPSLCSNAGMAC